MKNYTPQQFELNIKSKLNPLLELGIKQCNCDCGKSTEGGDECRCKTE
jgi:hypothetical protein